MKTHRSEAAEKDIAQDSSNDNHFQQTRPFDNNVFIANRGL